MTEMVLENIFSQPCAFDLNCGRKWVDLELLTFLSPVPIIRCSVFWTLCFDIIQQN